MTVEQKKRPTMFSLFSGVGGFDLGFLQSGFEVVGANEYSPEPTLTYLYNLGSYPVNIHYIEETDKERLNKYCEKIYNKAEKDLAEGKSIDGVPLLSGLGWIKSNPDYPPVRNFWFGDIRKLKGEDILKTLEMERGDIDVVTGGPPCQGFSIAGKREIADPRNNLVYEFGRIVVELQPKTFVMENVPDIVSMYDPDGVLVIDKFCLMLQEGGYGLWDKIKKALTGQVGCSTIIKSKPKKPQEGKNKESKPVEPTQQKPTEQLSLF